MSWYLLSGFADEISTDIVYQMDTLDANDIKFLDLRSAFNTNVLDFEEWHNEKLLREYTNRGFRFSAISTKLGKTPLLEPFTVTRDRLLHAVKLAKYYKTPFIRVFSFQLPEDASPLDFRDEVLGRLQAMTQVAQSEKITLLLENDLGLYGTRAEQVLDILQEVNSPALRHAFDFANYVQAGHASVLNECWVKLKEFVRYVHVKDFSRASGQVTVAGQGDGDVAAILADIQQSGKKMILAIEPHLSKTDGLKDESPAKQFDAAAAALKGILESLG